MRTRFLPATVASALLIGLLAAAPARASVHLVTAGDFFFEPTPVSVQVGDTVTFQVTGNGPHTVTAADGSFESGALYPGDTFALDVTAAGTVTFFCRFHGSPGQGMAGEILVDAPAAERLSGASNVDAALAWSRSGFADGSAPTVLIGRDDVFADSLASGGPQGSLGAPLLLTPPDRLAPAVRTELTRLGARNAVILGGTLAVSATVEGDLRSQGLRVERVAGATRYHTAVEVANRFLPNATIAIVARAFGDPGDPTRAFADSIAAGGLAARLGVPVLLSDSDALTGVTRDYLAASSVEQVIIAGGPAALSPAVEDALTGLGLSVQRAAGPTRFDTALALLLAAVDDAFPPAEGASTARAIIVDGQPGNADAWASGFPAAAHVGRRGAVLLANGDDLPASTLRILLGDRLSDRPAVVCAPNVSTTACDRAETAGTATGPLQPGNLHAFLSAAPGLAPPAAGSEGAVELFPTADPGTLCFSYSVLTFGGDPTAAAVHDAATDTEVVTMGADVALTGEVWGCDYDVSPTVLTALGTTPGAFEARISTAANSPEIVGPVFAPSFVLGAEMSGDQEVPGPGDPQGLGLAFVLGDQADPSRICWFYFAAIGEPATAAHIHTGERGVAGPVLIPLDTPSAPPVPVTWGCSDGNDPADVAAVAADPNGHYVNVHNDPFPAGAVRGQVFALGGPPTAAGTWPGP